MNRNMPTEEIVIALFSGVCVIVGLMLSAMAGWWIHFVVLVGMAIAWAWIFWGFNDIQPAAEGCQEGE